MLLEIENQLHKRIHRTLGQDAVVLRLAEELDKSGRVSEQTMIIVSFTSSETTNPNKGAYIPTVRARLLTYTLTLVQKQAQREGHSFALPLLDLMADSVTGWVPEVPGLEFRTGFELSSEKFVQITEEASQFIYEQSYEIEVSVSDGRFYSQPCAAYDPISIEDYLPKRTCLVTPGGLKTGLAVWRRKVNDIEYDEKVVDCDQVCKSRMGDVLEVTCSESLNGTATYRFIPKEAISYVSGDRIIDENKVVSGTLQKVWKCYRGNTGESCPPWFKVDVGMNLWRNAIDTVPNQDEGTSAVQQLQTIKTKHKPQ
jgi:hypothetical protein